MLTLSASAGITKDETDLGTVVSSGKGTVEVVLPTAQADIDLEYDQSLNNLRTRPMIIRGEVSTYLRSLRAPWLTYLPTPRLARKRRMKSEMTGSETFAQ